MQLNNILVTGGSGFVGSSVAIRLRSVMKESCVFVLDNLMRRGSELNLLRLEKAGIEFVHGDIRCPEDLTRLPDFDLLIDCSAEPSVHAGQTGSPLGVIHTNLVGTLNCYEAARQRQAAVLFLSSSRVYPIQALNSLAYTEGETRFLLLDEQHLPGCSAEGVTEDFPLSGIRSFYGATKLASELILQEYASSYGVRCLIYRCGVIAGPWQMGRVDQGFLSLWVARHYFKKALKYNGFGGQGKQVRDVLHIDDLCDLILIHLTNFSVWDGRIYTVGGGRRSSTSLLELSEICRAETGQEIPVTSQPNTSPMDVRIYLSDCTAVSRDTGWRPRRGVRDIVQSTARWIEEHESVLRRVF